jgi:hypothetical protein
MPSNFIEVQKDLGINADQLHRESEDFTQSIRKIKTNYYGKIPGEWITPILPDLPSLEEAITYINNNKIPITLPLPENESLNNNIKTLKKTFYFDKLPSEFIYEQESPDPELTLLPQLI